MNGEYLYYAAGFMSTFLISLILAIYAFKKRSISLHTFFILVMFSICIWSLASLMELISPAITQKIFWAKISWIGIATVSPFLFLFVLSYGKYEKYLKKSNIFLLMIIPAILIILALTNEFHHLIWASIVPVLTSIGTVLIYEHGPATWINLIYSYPLLIIGMFLMAYIFINSPKIYKFQTAVALIGITTPLIFNIAYLTGNMPELMDLTPVAFGITSILAALAIFKYQLLNILPVAHKNLFDNMTNGFLVFDMKDRLVEINPRAKKMFSLTSNDIGRDFNDIFEKEAQIKPLYFNLDANHEILLKNPENRWVNIQITSLYEELDVPCGKLFIITDINERKSYEIALKEKQRTLETLISNLPGVAYKCRNDHLWTMEFVSEGLKNLTGYPVEDLTMNKKVSYNEIIHPDDREYVWNEIQKSINENKSFELIYRINTADSEEKYVWEHGRRVYTNKEGLAIIEGFITDITSSKVAEEKLKNSLKEKNILLQEIHHRVKNNMQIISSLLNLQSTYIQEEETLNVLKESQSRIKAMALVHEKLYQSDSLANINFAGYVKSLINELYRSYRINKNLLNINIDVENIYLDINAAIPCSLIINELISNILKHAFPAASSCGPTGNKSVDPTADSRGPTDEKKISPANYVRGPANGTFASRAIYSYKTVNDLLNKGEINVDFSKRDDTYKLIISDNGIGLPPDINPNDTKTLGLQLVNALVIQLNGTIEINRDNGTEFIIVFSNPKTKDF